MNVYGRGRGRIEAILDATVDNLTDNFQKREGAPFDALEDLYQATALTRLRLVAPSHLQRVGVELGDEKVLA